MCSGACACSCVHRCMCVCRHMCVHACGIQSSISSVSPHLSPPYLWRQGLSLNLELSVTHLDCLVNWISGLPCLCPASNQHWDYRCALQHPDFCVVSRDLNVGPDSCVVILYQLSQLPAHVFCFCNTAVQENCKGPEMPSKVNTGMIRCG